MTGFRRTDKLTITFLVDNTIEWFGKLPPGFTNELRFHVTEQDPPIDPVTGAPVIDFENYCCGAHGFSALIETQVEGESESHLTLFDTGPESRSITRNIASMKAAVERVEHVVLSHWHSDHSGGLLAFLRARNAATAQGHVEDIRPCRVDLHPDRPIARGIAPGGKILARLDPDPTFEQIEELGGIVDKHADPHTIAGDTVYVSGKIPRVTEYEQGLYGAVRWVPGDDLVSGEWTPEEHIMDERYAAIDVVGKGLVILSACSHAGIVNVVKDAVKKLQRPIYMIIGGLHLGSPETYDRIDPTVDFLANKLRPAPTYVLPMHCSGFPVKVALEKALGEGCVPASTGMRVEVVGDHAAEQKMFPPVIA